MSAVFREIEKEMDTRLPFIQKQPIVFELDGPLSPRKETKVKKKAAVRRDENGRPLRRKKRPAIKGDAGLKPRPEDRPVSTKTVEGRVYVSRQYKQGRIVRSESSNEEPIAVRAYPANVPLGSVSFSGGLTENLGDFNSARYDVGVTLPCTVEELEDAYEAAVEIVSTRLRELEADIKREDD